MSNKNSNPLVVNNVIIQDKDVTVNLYINDDYSLIITDDIFNAVNQFFITDDKSLYKLYIKSKKTNITNEVLTAAVRMFLNEFTQSSFSKGVFTQHIRLKTLPYVLENKIFQDKCDDEIMRATIFFCIKIIASICKEREPSTSEKHLRCSLISDRSYRFRVYVSENILKDFCGKRNYIKFNMINHGIYMATDFVGEILYENIIPAYYIYLGSMSEKIGQMPDLLHLDKFEITAYGDVT